MYKKQTFKRRTALVLAILMIVETFRPMAAWALTSGPVQPEFQGFKPVEATNMVDLFTGNFSYNLPLFEIDGYPVNMTYGSNNRPEDEASWVGLGWNLNPGSVNREMRGLPDDFKGDTILKEYNIKNDFTVGGKVGGSVEIFGIGLSNASAGIFYNNKKGYGLTAAGTVGQNLGLINGSLSLDFNTQSGLDVGATLSKAGLTKSQDKNKTFNYGVKAFTNINSRQGLKAVSLSGNAEYEKKFKTASGGDGSSGFSAWGSGNIDLGGFHYLPTNPLPVLNQNYNLSIKGGGELSGFFPNGFLEGYLSAQSLKFHNQTQFAYGYLNHNIGQQNLVNILDVNRDNQLVYHENTPNLPVSYGTYDFFSVNGQGIGGQYRLFKNDVGILNAPYSSNNSITVSLGGEIGAGLFAHGGLDVTPTTVTSQTAAWIDNNSARTFLPFTNNQANYESAYFRESGEKTITDESFLNKIGGSAPIYTKLGRSNTTITAGGDFEIQRNKSKTGTTSLTNIAKKTERARRYNVFSYLTAEESKNAGLDTTFKNYPANTLIYGNNGTSPVCAAPQLISRLEKGKKHHISEISVLKPDGSRYIFGLPVYNLKQKEVTFSTYDTGKIHINEPYINYKHNIDNSQNNAIGRDNLYDAQTIPAYAHSFLLTGVLSDDYVDVKGDGITDDDLGNAVKFNYSRKDSIFKWRTPVALDAARQMTGMRADPYDDKGSYVYGEKDVWYPHSIESRNMVAQFYTSNRSDALGVTGENGGISSAQNLKKLDSIKVYSKSDLLMNGINAVPIKVVHFEYDYTLCPNTPNSLNALGKLTLRKVYFTFGTNGKGKLNAYKFGYKANDNSGAPFAYDPKLIDRWGNYKKHPARYPAYTDYPYSLQDSALANSYAGAWNMDTIYLPSGGSIIADFESNDYAYVQNKRAGQMFFIKGFSKDTNLTSVVPNLYGGSSIIPYAYPAPNNYIALDITAYSKNLDALSPTNADAQAAKLFFADVTSLYFKALVQLTTDTSTKEYITGYLNFDVSKVHYNGSKKWLMVPVSTITDNKNQIHPITLAALQTLRLNLPDLAYSVPGRQSVAVFNKNNIIDALRGLSGFFSELTTLFAGYNRDRVQKGWANTADTSNMSWLRLSNPTGKKYGGGSRVKKITVADNWNAPNGGGASNYIQSFTYTTIEGGTSISSGVAAYEPQLGGEEISLKEPMPYTDPKVLLAPDNSFYNEKPIGESFYPAPVIGYGEVRVESVYPNVKRTGTGYSTSKFFTAKDYPVISDFTNISDGTVKAKPSTLSSLFKFNVVDQRGISQGFSVETNDMHGKMKEEATYNQQGSLLSATNYYYKTDSVAQSGKMVSLPHLSNTVAVANPDGSIVSRNMGLDIDMWQDMQEDNSNTITLGVSGNIDAFLPFGFIPIPITYPGFYPVFQNERKGVKTSITSKHIKRQGILDKVVKTIDGSTIATQNLLYDMETGDVIATKTQNEFNDPVYQFNYPAHWAYDGMGPAYKNIGNIFKGVRFDATGRFIGSSLPNANTYFTSGDEITLRDESTGTLRGQKYYVVQPNSASTLGVYDNNGGVFTGSSSYTVKIIRSGRRNKAGSTIGSIASLASPINAAGTNISIGAAANVLQASAKEYSDSWKMSCAHFSTGMLWDSLQFGMLVNPYVTGLRGNWRPRKNFVYYDVRNKTSIPTSTAIRTDGYIPNFTPYFTYSAMNGNWGSTSDSRWVRSDSIALYDVRGNEIESADANNVISAAYYGYNKTQVVAVTANSKNREQTFESFEDYKFMNDCANTTAYKNDKNLRFFKGDSLDKGGFPIWNLVDTVAHTGRYSLRINPGKNYTVYSIVGTDTCTTSPPSATINVQSKCADCLPIFTLDAGKKYILSYWVATDSSLTCNAVPPDSTISINTNGGAVISYAKVATSPVIDGWQKREASFTTPATGGSQLNFKMQSPLAAQTFYDDIRVFPFNAKMKSYVYDIRSRRLMAELDENNYATFYEYDDEGILVRIKRETETGRQTVKEARNYLVPNNQ